MAEQSIQDLALATTFEDGDLLNIQRRTSGIWRNYAMGNIAFNGLDVRVVKKLWDVSLFYSNAEEEVLPDISGDGRIYAPLFAYVSWPGDASPPGGSRQFRLKASASNIKVMNGTVTLDATARRAALGYGALEFRSTDGMSEIKMYEVTGFASGSGTIALWLQYAIIDESA